MSQSDSSDHGEAESKRPFRPNRPSSAGTLLDPRSPNDELETAGSWSDRKAIAKSRSNERRCQYDRCETTFRRGAGHDGCCSLECWSRQEAVKILRGIRYDDRICANCFTILKEKEPPPFGSPDWIIAEQFFHPDRTTRALGDIPIKRPLVGDSWSGDADDNDELGEYILRILESRDEKSQCTCTACHHTTIHWPDKFPLKKWTREILPALIDAIAHRRGGNYDGTEFSADALYDTLCERHDEREYCDTDGSRKLLEAALGHAIRFPHYTSD